MKNMKYAIYYCTGKIEISCESVEHLLTTLTSSDNPKRSAIAYHDSEESTAEEMSIKESRIYTIRDDSGRYIAAEWYESWETDEENNRLNWVSVSAFPPAVVIDDMIYHRGYGWSCYGFRSEAEEVAEKLRASGEWDMELAGELCRISGLEDEWDAAEEEFESVVEKAANLLHVEIY